MLYLQQFQNNRVDYLKQYQRFHSSLDRNFSLCSNQYIEKFPKFSRPETSNIDYSRDQTLFFLSKKSSIDMVGKELLSLSFDVFTYFMQKCNFDLINHQVKCINPEGEREKKDRCNKTISFASRIDFCLLNRTNRKRSLIVRLFGSISI
jgi:hypothetical protein